MKWTAAVVVILLFLPLPAAGTGNGSDLSVTWIRAPPEVREGALPTVTARVDNHGSDVVSDVTVSFYLDSISEGHLIARRHYDSVNVYRRPRITWDTSGVTGNHSILAHIDGTSRNNVAATNVTVRRNNPTSAEQRLLISELYPHPYPGDDNEYICIHNPTGRAVNLYHWRLTTTPHRRLDRQTRVVFPNIHIPAHGTLHIAQNASAYQAATGHSADYAYGNDGHAPALEEHGWFILSNDGAALCLKDGYNHTIDSVAYGDSRGSPGWQGPPVSAPGEGVLLYRGNITGDSNTGSDWRTRHLDASSWQPYEVTFTGNVTAFASPDSAFSVVKEEIANATDSLYINLYTFTNPWLCDAVCAAAARNVSVTLLLEGQPVGGLSIEQRYMAARIAGAGGDVRYMYHGEGRRRYRYNHAKYAVVDNSTAIVTSANWGVTGMSPAASYGNREWGIVLRNESIARFIRRVLQDDLSGSDVVAFNASNETYGAPPDMYLPPRWPPRGDYRPCCPARTVQGTFACTVVAAPDNAERAIRGMLNGGRERILVEQAYIEPRWSDEISPFLACLAGKSGGCTDVRVLMNQNPSYLSSCDANNLTRAYLARWNLSSRFVYANASALVNVHTKGAVVDNATLVSSINWNENAVRCNRELGVIVEHPGVAAYFAKVFNHDWHLAGEEREHTSMIRYEHVRLFAVAVVWTAAAAVLFRHWRG
ncbi:MAG: phospholipase D-like domain-containing protein [Thermoplasmatota archaeon]